MSQISNKVVAIFVTTGPRDEKNNTEKQAVLRECAAKLGLIIASFVAIPKTFLLERLSQALRLCKTNEAGLILIDEIKTLFLTHKELASFIKILEEYKISVVIASDEVILRPEHLSIFLKLLEISTKAQHEQHALSIKKSLRLKKRQGKKLGGKKFGVKPDEPEIIKQILDMHAAGKSLQEICNILSINNIKSAHNKKWYPTTLKRIIERDNN